MNSATSRHAIEPLCYHCAARDPARPRARACIACMTPMTSNGTPEP